MPFRAPAGARLVRIDRASGKPVFGAWPGTDPKAAVIWEVFKPESEARRAMARAAPPTPEERARAIEAQQRAARAQDRARDSDFLQREGGIY